MRKGENISSPFLKNSIFQFIIQLFFKIFEHPGPGFNNSFVNHLIFIVMCNLASFTHKVLNIISVFIQQNLISADCTFPWDDILSCQPLTMSAYTVKKRIVYQIQCLILNPLQFFLETCQFQFFCLLYINHFTRTKLKAPPLQQ